MSMAKTESDRVCGVCRKQFPESEMVCLEGQWVCAACKPVFVQMLKEGASPNMVVARQGKTLVMGRDATLPDRCIKCNAPTNGRRLPLNLYWHHPLVYLLVLLNILIYALVAVAVRKKARIEVGLCDAHRAKRRVAIAVTWALVLAAAGLFVAAAALESVAAVFLGLAALLAAIIDGAVAVPVVSARRIDKEYVWLNGACKDYLAALPEWQGPRG